VMARQSKTPTIADVATAAGVSISTVSRVVRDHTDVSAPTRAVVLAAIDRMGYHPSSIARALVSGRSQTIGLLVSDITNPFYPQLAKSVEREAARHGYRVIMSNTDDSVEETKELLSRLIAHGIDGIVHASVGVDEELVRDSLEERIPLVFTNRRPQSTTANFVVADNELGARRLAQHMVQLGHRRLGFIGGPAFAANAQERLRGFRSVMSDSGLDSDLVAEAGFDIESGRQVARQWLIGPNRPSAIIGVNDLVTLGAMEAALEIGLRIPADVAMAGFDDIQLASSTLIGLTSVSQHIDRMGQRAVQVLLELMEEPAPDEPIQEILLPTLRIRRSTESTEVVRLTETSGG
jgi:LacI family transcriptional regulator, galactose operon repressor